MRGVIDCQGHTGGLPLVNCRTHRRRADRAYAAARPRGLAAVLLGSLVVLLDGVRGHAGLPFQPGVVLTGVALLILFAGAGDVSMDRVMWSGAGAEKKPASRGA